MAKVIKSYDKVIRILRPGYVIVSFVLRKNIMGFL